MSEGRSWPAVNHQARPPSGGGGGAGGTPHSAREPYLSVCQSLPYPVRCGLTVRSDLSMNRSADHTRRAFTHPDQKTTNVGWLALRTDTCPAFTAGASAPSRLLVAATDAGDEGDGSAGIGWPC